MDFDVKDYTNHFLKCGVTLHTDEVKQMRVFIADDQPNVRSALRLLLEQDPGVSVVGEAAEAEGLLAGVRATRPDLLLSDWELPGLQAANPLLPTLRALSLPVDDRAQRATGGAPASVGSQSRCLCQQRSPSGTAARGHRSSKAVRVRKQELIHLVR